MGFFSSSTKVYRFEGVRDAAAGEGADNVGQFFCLNDLNLRGSVASAVAAKGVGGGIELAINPFGFVGLNTEVSVAQEIKGAKQRSVVLMGGPEQIQVDGDVRRIPEPIVVNSFVGAYFQSKTQVGLEVSVGFEAKAVIGSDGSSSAETETKDGSTDAEEEDENEPSILAEIAVAKFEAKAGFKAEASYTYDKFIAEDPLPMSFERRTLSEKVFPAVNAILEEGSIKSMIKAQACDHINANSQAAYGGKTVALHTTAVWGLWNSTMGVDDVLKVLRGVKSKNPDLLAVNRNFIERLSAFESKKRPGKNLLVLSSHSADGKAGAFAGFEATAKVAGVGLGTEAEVFAGVTGAYKRAYARYQSCAKTVPYAKPGLKAGEVASTEIMTTYDTCVVYSSFKLGVELSLEAEFSYGVGGVDLLDNKVGKAVTDGLEAASDAMTYNVINRMRYRTAIATWARPVEGLDELKRKTVPVIKGFKGLFQSPCRLQVPALNGTGVAFGESFTIENLRKLYERILIDPEGAQYKNLSQKQELRARRQERRARRQRLLEAELFKPNAVSDKQLIAIAEQMHVTPAKLLKFLTDFEVRMFILGSEVPESAAILLEATFKVDTLDLEVDCHKDGDGEFHAALATNTSDRLFAAAKLENLQSIRLRYRRKDAQVNDKKLFSLGFDKFLGNELKITLERVDRAGHDAIVDVRTVFVDSSLAALQARDPGGCYETAVPPAALFIQ